MLAWLDEAEVREILAPVVYERKTANTHMSADELLAELVTVREKGFSEDKEEQEEGLRCVGVPVYDRFGHVIAGLSISFPTIRFNEDELTHYVHLLHIAAANISEQLGFSQYPFL